MFEDVLRHPLAGLDILVSIIKELLEGECVPYCTWREVMGRYMFEVSCYWRLTPNHWR
jgi:hypothetical protein